MQFGFYVVVLLFWYRALQVDARSRRSDDQRYRGELRRRLTVQQHHLPTSAPSSIATDVVDAIVSQQPRYAAVVHRSLRPATVRIISRENSPDVGAFLHRSFSFRRISLPSPRDPAVTVTPTYSDSAL